MKNQRSLAVGLVVLALMTGSACTGNSDVESNGASVPAPQAAEKPPEDTPPSPLIESNTANDAENEGLDRSPSDAGVLGMDYLTFAQGAVPVSIGGAGAALKANFEHAVRIIDGDPGHFTFVNKADSTTDTEFIYELPALTTFERFGVPNVNETPSPLQTFTKYVEVYGSTTSPEEGWTLLASKTLETHAERDQVTELDVVDKTPVRWIKVRLMGGIEIYEEQSFFEFSEILGYGSQETPVLVDYFDGIWKGRGVLMELKQEGATVTGCYDDNAELNGTVSGNILRAQGIDPDDGAPSLFILSVVGDGHLRGVRSSNGGPFRLYTGPTAPPGTTTQCSEIPEPTLGCGSIIHGINFDFDSATIRPDSEPVLAGLYDGLQGESSASIVITGHTSSEGAEAYNQRLSEQRAQAVVADLVRRGLEASRIVASGSGEAEPIASNTDESGRSLNRRVEVTCGE